MVADLLRRGAVIDLEQVRFWGHVLIVLKNEKIFVVSLLSLSLMSLPAVVAPVVASPTELAAPTKVLTEAEIAKARGKGSEGSEGSEVGIAVVDTQRKKQFFYNEKKLFPMQSVCKLPVSIAILRLADAGKLSVKDKITVRKADVLTIHSPIKKAIKGKQSDFTIRNLITRSICDSDNTTCDILISRAGGAAAVTRLLEEADVKGVRIDRPEGKLQPDSLKIETFLSDPRDTTSPEAMVDLLQKLYSGKLLSKKSTALILQDMFNCQTGQSRIKAGLPAGWTLAHKTGTGRDVSGQNAGTNDVGVAVGPAGETIYFAIFVKGSKAKIEAREALMAKVAAKACAGEL